MPAGGQEITGQQGSLGQSGTVPLRSRKDALGSANYELVGQSIAVQQGAFAKSSTKALSGSAITGAQGTVVYTTQGSQPGAPLQTVEWQSEMLSFDDIKRDWENPTMSPFSGWSSVDWPEYGLRAIRTESDSINSPNGSGYGPTIIGTTAKRYLFEGTRAVAGAKALRSISQGHAEEAWCRYGFLIDPDVAAGMNDIGVKMPGFEAWWLDIQNGLGFSCRMEHGQPRGDGKFEIYGYFYGPGWTDAGFGGFIHMTPNVWVSPGVKFWVEQHIKLNTPGVANGVMEVRIRDADGNIMGTYTRTNVPYRNSLTNGSGVPHDVTHFFGNVYHGGANTPLNRIHHEFAAPAVSFTGWIGMPNKVPTWRQGMALFEWKEIPGTKLSDFVATKPSWTESGLGDTSSIYGAWNGAGVDENTSTMWWAAPGGHADYHGNQAFGIRLDVDAPAFVEARPPTPFNLIQPYLGPGGVTAYRAGDGHPFARHTYYDTHNIKRRGWVGLFFTHAPSSNGGFFDPATAPNGALQCEAYSIANGQYRPENTIPDRSATSPFAPQWYEGVARHGITEDVYIWLPSAQVLRWRETTSTFASTGGSSLPSNIGVLGAIDDRRNRLFATGGGAAHTFDLAALTVTTRTLTGNASHVSTVATENQSTTNRQRATEFVKHPSDSTQDFFITRGHWSGGVVYRINAVTFAVDSPTTSGGSGIPQAGNNGVFNRMRYFPKLGCVVYAVNTTSNLWALRVV